MEEQRNTRIHVQITIFLITVFIFRGVRNENHPYEGPPTPPGDQGGEKPPGLPGESTVQTPRYTHASSTKRRRRRTTPPRLSFSENCDYLAFYCLKAYKTGVVCGRTMYYTYANFMTYCQLDYVNCMERYELWQLAHMGECMEVAVLSDYLHYEYVDDYFLDRDFVSDD